MTAHSQLAHYGLFDARVPRYTSYPTAPQFAPTIGHGFFRDALHNIAAGSAVSLYIHVPFCRRLCWFCACRTQGTSTLNPVRAYLDTLKQEIALLKAELPDGLHLSRMHWGGGTPTLLTPDMMSDLAETVFDVLPLGPEAEFSVEIDPNEIDPPRLAALSSAGMTRASIGVQDFDSEIQDAIGRQQSYELTKEAADMIRDHGIDSLNADILFGLPHQTNARIAESVQKLLTLAPDRVALYGYAHVPWMSKRQQLIPTGALPTPQERLSLYDTAKRLFTWDGYNQIGIDHFATPDDGLAQAAAAGQLRRNFQGYTDDQAKVLIGLGASSISRFPQGYAQNAPATSAYTGLIRDGQFATKRGHMFSDDDRLRGRLIEALMCDFRIDAAEIKDRFGVTSARLAELFAPAVQQFHGVVTADSRGLHIHDDARALTRMIARAFDAYDLSKAGHSSAV